MPFPFVYVCDILDRLERPHLRDVPYLPNHYRSTTREMTIEWFKLHRHRLNHFNTSDQAVLLMLQPEKHTDRVYGLDPDRLELIIARALSLPREHYIDLQSWRKEPLKGDLAVCVSRVMENYKTLAFRSQTNSVTVEEIDQALLRIAAFNSGSSEAVQSLAKNWGLADETQLLGRLYMRLQGREAKWLTRIVLKDYGPVKFPEDLVLGSNHSSLPNCLQVSVQLSIPASSAIRLQGTGVIKGVDGAGHVAQPVAAAISTMAAVSELTAVAKDSPPTPPTSALQSSSLTQMIQRERELPSPLSTAPEPVCPVKPASIRRRTALAPLSSNSQNSPRQNSQKNNPRSSHRQSYVVVGPSSCQLASKSCLLRNFIFLLSPCISDSVYITNDLLSWHGAHYVTSLSNLKIVDLPRRCSKTGERYCKVALVESHHANKTVDFLKKVMRLKSTHSGIWETVQVYDWRLLESISKAETGKKLTHDPWKRLWILDI